MKILFPTDLSEESLASIRRIVPFVVNRKKQSEIQLLHVVERPVQGTTLMVDISKIMMGDAEAQLRKEKQKFAHDYEVPVKQFVRIGYFENELKDFVQKMKPDLVVLVSRQRHGIMKYLIGRQSLKFIGDLEAPLMIIPEESDFSKISKLGWAVDKDENPTLETSGRIHAIADYYGARVDMVHISSKEEENLEFYDRLEKAAALGNVQLVKKTDIREGIQMWCTKNKIDMLITLTHGKSAFRRTFSGSVTKDLVKSNAFPLLIINQ